jgi:uncharacterized protein YndB with AHSA1/START domain
MCTNDRGFGCETAGGVASRLVDEVSVTIAAPPERLWSLVTDVTQMGRWSPECKSCSWVGSAAGPAVGAQFRGKNRHGLARWTTDCTVTAADPPGHFEFQVRQSGMRWGYRFEPDGQGGTVVTEYREKTKPVPAYIKLVQRSGLIGRNREQLMVEGMRTTLDRIKHAAEAAS